jgi:hypothetical protein
MGSVAGSKLHIELDIECLEFLELHREFLELHLEFFELHRESRTLCLELCGSVLLLARSAIEPTVSWMHFW